MEPKRVVVTGMGIISSVGNDLDTYWKNLVDGVCGIDYVEDFKDMPVTIAGKVKDFDPEQYDMDKAFVRKQDKFTQFAMAAAWQAMVASGLKTEGEDMNIDPFRLGAPESKFPTNIGDHGNSSSASCPILLDECKRKGLFKKGDKLIFSAFGAGLLTAAALVEW